MKASFGQTAIATQPPVVNEKQFSTISFHIFCRNTPYTVHKFTWCARYSSGWLPSEVTFGTAADFIA